MKKTNFTYLALIAGATLLLGACSTTENSPNTSLAANDAQASEIAPASGGEISDPLESSNRRIFKFNNAVDHVVINPVVKGYRTVVPRPARKGVRNFLRNLKSPTTFANQALQGDIGGAADVVGRFAINSTIGVLGIFDVAERLGLKYEPEDFGQTLGVWGVGHGPYLVVPILGPSSVRDYAGYFVDSYADPLRWFLFGHGDAEGWYYAKVAADYIDLRESLIDVLADLEKSSIDYYAAVRSTYYQRREAMKDDESANAVPSADEFAAAE